MSRLLTSSEVPKFKKILQNYRLHESGLAQFQDSSFAIIAGPAGAGKDTLRDELIRRYPEFYVPILSTTTRPPRAGEIDGVTYHFAEVEAVKQGLIDRVFFQAELVHEQQISCLNISEIEKLKSGQFGLSILITETERKLSSIKSDIKTVFLIPPDLETLQTRMQSERMLHTEEIKRRLIAARHEIQYAVQSEHYYCLITDTVERAVGAVHDYLQTGTRADDRSARDVMHSIIKSI